MAVAASLTRARRDEVLRFGVLSSGRYADFVLLLSARPEPVFRAEALRLLGARTAESRWLFGELHLADGEPVFRGGPETGNFLKRLVAFVDANVDLVPALQRLRDARIERVIDGRVHQSWQKPSLWTGVPRVRPRCGFADAWRANEALQSLDETCQFGWAARRRRGRAEVRIQAKARERTATSGRARRRGERMQFEVQRGSPAERIVREFANAWGEHFPSLQPLQQAEWVEVG